MLHEPKNKPNDMQMVQLIADVVAAYVSNNRVEVSQIPEVVENVRRSLSQISIQENKEPMQEMQKPAVSIRRSITPDYVVCLEDGKKLKMLKRHLRTTYNLSPEEYRAKWNLPSDYPMVAPNYAKQRSEFAKKIGLGRKF